MASPVLVALLVGCPEPDPLEGLPTLPFEQTGSTAVRLDRLPAEYVLPPTSPGAGGGDGTFPVGPFRRTRGPDVYEAELPFAVGRAAEAGQPRLTVRVGDRVLPFDASFAQVNRRVGAWRVDRDKLVVLLDHEPAEGEVVIEHAQLRTELDRLRFGPSGLPAEQFVRFGYTRDQRTWNGLLLPAPASATWRVTVPEAGVFRASLSLIEPPLMASRSDGATVALVVAADGAESVAGAVEISDPAAPGVAFDVDLAKWAGREVALRLETRPGDSADDDYVLVSAPTLLGRPTAQPRRVVVLAIDTLRPDHLGFYGYERATSPELDALAADSTVFERAWAPAPRTRPSFRTATTGRYPLEAIGATNIGEVFAGAGFATAGVVANIHLHPRFGFDDGFDFWWVDPEAKADHQVDRALDWLEQHRTRDTYLFLHIMDPHLFYVAPRPYYDRFVIDADPKLPRTFNRWQVYGWDKKNRLDERRKEHIEALYDGEIAWTSHQVGRLIEALDRLGGNTLLVFHTDHGEEFWEHGGFEHNHTLYDEVVRAALWFRVPGRDGRKVSVPATLADIGPTLYDYAGITDAPKSDGISLRPFIDGDAAPPDRPLPVGYLHYDKQRWGVVWRDHKYIIGTDDGVEELYDLVNDPRETKNLAATTDPQPWRDALRRVHALDIGPGWRVRVRVSRPEPVTFTLPAPCLTATIIDPEAQSRRPANQEWGEKPKRRPEDIGVVTVSADRTTVTWVPGRDPQGLLVVRFAEPVAAPPAITRAGQALALSDEPTPTWSGEGERIRIEPGTIVIPPPDEAVVMAERTSGEAQDSELQLLESLGYLAGEDGGP